MNRLEENKDGELIYDFAFVNGMEVEVFAKQIADVNYRISSVLDSKASWYYNSFRKDLLLTSKKEKQKFFEKIRENPPECSGRLSLINRTLLLNVSIGFNLSLLVAPAYKFWRRIKCIFR